LRISKCRISAYGNGKDGTFSLADARRERDKAKDLLKEGKDPSTEKQLDKHRQAAARPFDKWADEWLAKKKLEKVKRGRIVAVRDPKTIEVLELRVGCVKDRFGKVTCSNRVGRAISRQGTPPRPSRGGARVTNDSGVVRLARA
jgi:hypothetical protein